MKNVLRTLLALVLVSNAYAATTRNDDSCDVAVMPAATLLLPYFEVDLDNQEGETTLVTITNVTNLDRIARITLWTDRGYPVFTFNVVLTGYDAYSVNLYDILGRGDFDANERPSWLTQPRGPFSDPNPAHGACTGTSGVLSAAEVARLQAAFTTGAIAGECDEIGGAHDNAVGYATIDVVGNCSTNTPKDAAYWNTDLRYDNVLLGDYQQLVSATHLAQGGPLVHIRAVPEGGTPGERRPSDDAGFPRTFYSRFQSATSPRLDARQPLPSQFAARWTEGTSLKIWREGRAGRSSSCADYAADENLAVTDVVAFDEHENAAGLDRRIELAASTKTAVDDPLLPQLMNGASNGWIYLNLDRSSRDDFGSQGWVVSSTRVEGRYSSDMDAIALGNGCSPGAEEGAQIAPAPDDNERSGVAMTDNDDSCDIALLPAATLLLPYFEVDLEDPQGETTIFTVTNVSPEDRIARVTLWTDYAFPVISFNVYLTGYDVQSINLFDVIQRGLIAPDAGTGTQVSERGPLSERNFALDLRECGELVAALPAGYGNYMRQAFTEGTVPELGSLPGCSNVGNEHDHAVGYATIDVVRNCEENLPASAEYWTEDIAWDNVLIGDYHQVDSGNDFAQSSTMVHIRAVPEGGTAAERLAVQRRFDAGFPRTFYARLQPANAPKLDGRQPLPSVFAARLIQGSIFDYQTSFKIWREGRTDGSAACATWDDNFYMFAEAVRFDEAENAWGFAPSEPVYPIFEPVFLPATSRISAADQSILPHAENGAIGGWMYLNLDDRDDERPWAMQAWVVTSMRAQGRFSVDIDAASLGNGCSPEVPLSETTIGTEVIGPRP